MMILLLLFFIAYSLTIYLHNLEIKTRLCSNYKNQNTTTLSPNSASLKTQAVVKKLPIDLPLLPKAEAVVLTVNTNPRYMSWIPIVCRFWHEIGIQPHLFIIHSGSWMNKQLNLNEQYYNSIDHQ